MPIRRKLIYIWHSSPKRIEVFDKFIKVFWFLLYFIPLSPFCFISVGVVFFCVGKRLMAIKCAVNGPNNSFYDSVSFDFHWFIAWCVGVMSVSISDKWLLLKVCRFATFKGQTCLCFSSATQMLQGNLHSFFSSKLKSVCISREGDLLRHCFHCSLPQLLLMKNQSKILNWVILGWIAYDIACDATSVRNISHLFCDSIWCWTAPKK